MDRATTKLLCCLPGYVGHIRNECKTRFGNMLLYLYIIKALESYAYFSLCLNFAVFLTSEFGFDDTDAGWTFGVFGFLISAYGVVVGVVIDFLGVKWSLFVGMVLQMATRFLVLWLTDKLYIRILFLTIAPLAGSFCIPVLSIAVKRHSNESTRAEAFAFFYVFMNFGALAAGPSTDIIRHHFPNGVVLFGHPLTDLRIVFLTGLCTTTIALIMVIFYKDKQVSTEGKLEQFHVDRSKVLKVLYHSVRSAVFWRLAFFTLLICGVRLIFRHLDGTLPKYLLRTQGDNVKYGTIYSINPIMVICLVPMVATLTKKRSPYKVIVFGSYIAGASAFWLCVGTQVWTSVVFVITLSLGEVIYSPKVYEYVMLVAPKGGEGVYASLPGIPMFAAKLFAGGLSGWLLQKYCPEDPTAPRNTQMMWFIIGCTSFSSPVLMTVFGKCIYKASDINKPVPWDSLDDTLAGAEECTFQEHPAPDSPPSPDSASPTAKFKDGTL